MLTISKLKRWSINYYIDTARTAATAGRDAARAGGGLGEYYSEHETRTPTWLLAGDTHAVAMLASVFVATVFWLVKADLQTVFTAAGATFLGVSTLGIAIRRFLVDTQG